MKANLPYLPHHDRRASHLRDMADDITTRTLALLDDIESAEAAANELRSVAASREPDDIDYDRWADDGGVSADADVSYLQSFFRSLDESRDQ